MATLIRTILDDPAEGAQTPRNAAGKAKDFMDDEDELGFEISANSSTKKKKSTTSGFFKDLINASNKNAKSPWNFSSARRAVLTHNPETYTPTSIEQKIQQKKRKLPQETDHESEEDDIAEDEDENNDENVDDDVEDENDENDENDDDDDDDDDGSEDEHGTKENEAKLSAKTTESSEKAKKKKQSASDDDDDEDNQEETGPKIDFAPNPLQNVNNKTFKDLNLSRPLLKAIEDLSYTTPTSIQLSAIPVVLLGRDVCGSAQTGSGKTAAFLLPILERLSHRNKRIASTRVLILLPTRELAAQCHSVCENLAKHTDIRSCLVVGGLSGKVQEAELRSRPDIIVATPGRILDHLRNTHSFSLEDLDILVLDEADRLLEMGFIDEIEQIVKECPKSRQTVLFSATMTEQVDQLAKMSLKNPIRVSVDSSQELVSTLTQEFVRVRSNDIEEREALLIALCQRTYKSKTIVFFQEKKQCHRARIIFGLFGLKAAELHGNLTQQQRLDALENFRDGQVNFMLSTDLAARGLDILGIQTVINFDMPRTLTNYIHRVGRTARAGRSGVAVSLIGEGQRAILKKILKMARNKVKQRAIDSEVASSLKSNLIKYARDIEDILGQERDEKQMRLAEQELKKAENMIKYDEDIRARPAKTWFVSEKGKHAIKEKAKMEREALHDAEEGEGDAKAGDKKKGKKEKPGKDGKKDQKKLEKKIEKMSRVKRRRLIAIGDDDVSKILRNQKVSAKGKKEQERLVRHGLAPKSSLEKKTKDRKRSKRPGGGSSEGKSFFDSSKKPAARQQKKGKSFKSKGKFKRKK